MKRYEKSKFWLLWNDGSKKEPKEGEYYFNREWRWKLKFPFLFRIYICYILKDSVWIEESE